MTSWRKKSQSIQDIANNFWKQLSPTDRDELGNQFVLGNYDWKDWWIDPPQKGVMNEVEKLRMLWEMGGRP